MRRLPTALVAVCAVAFLHSAAWAVLTPVMQVPDEPVHLGYLQNVAEKARFHQENVPSWAGSPELVTVFEGLPWTITSRPSWSPVANAALERDLDRPLTEWSPGNAGYVANNPPLYHAIMAAPYLLNEALGGDALDMILLVRLATALLSALTVAGIWLFLRELLPGTPWAWTVGALAVGLQPVFGFISGGVHNDNLMNAAGAWLLFLSARVLRDGLTTRRGMAIGGVVATALMTKVSAYAMVGVLLLVLALAVYRAVPRTRLAAVRAAVVAFAVAVVPIIVYSAAAARSGGAATGGLGGASSAGIDWLAMAQIRDQLSYTWQYFLPKLWFMREQHAGQGLPVYDTYFKAFVGRFGWFQFGFSDTFNHIALGVYGVIAGFFAAGVWRAREAVRQKWPLVLAMAGFCVLLLAMVTIAAYRYREINGKYFEQTRYLLPAIGVYAAFVAIAARGAGRTWGPALGVLMVVLTAGNSIAGMLLTLNRYYA